MQINIRMSDKLRDRLRYVSRVSGRSESEIVRQGIHEVCVAMEKQYGLVRDGEEDE